MRTLVSIATISIVVTMPGSTWTSSRNSVTAATRQAPQVTVFEGARLIVGDGSTVDDGILVVEGGVITRVGKRDVTVVPQGATRVSLVGKTIMPLLVDLHGHIGFLKDGVFAAENYTSENIRDQLQRLEYYGVGAFQSLGTDLGLTAFDVREEQRAGKTGGARLLLAGRGFVAPGGGPMLTPLEHVPFEVDQPALARVLVRELVAKKIDMIKLWVDDRLGQRPKLAPEIYRAIIDEAHKSGTRVMAHVFYLADAKELVRAGVDGFAHMVRDVEIDDEFLKLAKEHRVFQATSMAVQARPVETWRSDPAFVETTPKSVLDRLIKDPGLLGQAGAAAGSAFMKVVRPNVAKLKAAGVRLALGGDTGLPISFVGYHEHLELQAMVEAGLTPLEAVTAGSSTPASILGLKDLGTLSAGKSADFMVLNGNPWTTSRTRYGLATSTDEGTRLTVSSSAPPGSNRPRLASNRASGNPSRPVSAFGFC